MSLRLRSLLTGLACAGVFAGAAEAGAPRYLAFDADSDAARHRTADVVLVVKPGVLGQKVERLFRKRGKDFAVERSDGPFSDRQLKDLLGRDDAEAVNLYAVDKADGEGFAHGACKGADRAWLALRTPERYKPLRIYVLSFDAASKTPAVCETLDYRWRGEWSLPPKKSYASSATDENGPPPRGN